MGEVSVYFDTTNRCDNNGCDYHRRGRCVINKKSCPLRCSVTTLKPEEVRDKIIERDRELLEKLNTGSKKGRRKGRK